MYLKTSDIMIEDLLKGVPWGTAPCPVSSLASQNWNVLSQDLPLPLAVLKQSAIDINSAWMREFLKESGALFAPHGKTTMSPQLFERQLEDGAWGITLATAAQMQVARRFGISRIVLANQLVGRQAMNFIFSELKRDPEFDFYCLADSAENVAILAQAAAEADIGRPLQMLIEGGVAGSRTGARSLEDAMKVARQIKAAGPHLSLRGVEGFEGVIAGNSPDDTNRQVAEFISYLGEIAQACEAEALFGPGPIVLSAGGSAFYDLVTSGFDKVALKTETQIVVRSGCYLTHDSILYEDHLQSLTGRASTANWGQRPQAALEVWADVLSRPEPTRVLLNLGKRDASYDAGLPKPLTWFRPDHHTTPEAVPEDHVSVSAMDQHLFMDVPETSPLGVGDMVSFGISHPCLTFDKWQFIPVVDDEYNVVSGIRTYF